MNTCNDFEDTEKRVYLLLARIKKKRLYDKYQEFTNSCVKQFITRYAGCCKEDIADYICDIMTHELYKEKFRELAKELISEQDAVNLIGALLFGFLEAGLEDNHDNQ